VGGQWFVLKAGGGSQSKAAQPSGAKGSYGY